MKEAHWASLHLKYDVIPNDTPLYWKEDHFPQGIITCRGLALTLLEEGMKKKQGKRKMCVWERLIAQESGMFCIPRSSPHWSGVALFVALGSQQICWFFLEQIMSFIDLEAFVSLLFTTLILRKIYAHELCLKATPWLLLFWRQDKRKTQEQSLKQSLKQEKPMLR